jgi:hypothetical protein
MPSTGAPAQNGGILEATANQDATRSPSLRRIGKLEMKQVGVRRPPLYHVPLAALTGIPAGARAHWTIAVTADARLRTNASATIVSFEAPRRPRSFGLTSHTLPTRLAEAGLATSMEGSCVPSRPEPDMRYVHERGSAEQGGIDAERDWRPPAESAVSHPVFRRLGSGTMNLSLRSCTRLQLRVGASWHRRERPFQNSE